MDASSFSASTGGASAGSGTGPAAGSAPSSASDPFLDGAGFFPGLPPGHGDTTGRSAVVIGGAMAGLGAAHALSRAGYDVALYERQSYDQKRVNCGEAITDASLIPVEKTPENGFQCSASAFEVQVRDGSETTSARFPSSRGYVADRNAVERRWAERLAGESVAVREETSVSRAEVGELIEEQDLVVDATGQPSIASRAEGATGEYAGAMTAINADVEGDFSDLHPRALIVFEDYLGYAWCFPKTEDRANVGIGWAQDESPAEFRSALEDACERNDWPTPPERAANVAIIPRGPSLDPRRTYDPKGVVRVGDAAGIANRFTGKGISQAIHSSYLMAALAAHDRLAEYPRRLHSTMRSEYVLSYVVRGTLEDGRLDLLQRILRAVEGVDVEAVDRDPRKALSRLARHPLLCGRLLACPAIRRRAYRGLRDDWEYAAIEAGPGERPPTRSPGGALGERLAAVGRQK
jgi:digeranylgeranylglycerophospholipid reductase